MQGQELLFLFYGERLKLILYIPYHCECAILCVFILALEAKLVSSAMAYSLIHVVLTLVFEPQGQGDYNARKTCLAFVPFVFIM